MTLFPVDTAKIPSGSGVLGIGNVRVPVKPKKTDKAIKISPIRRSLERKYAYVYETPESKSNNSFDKYSDSACPGAWSSNCTGVVHHICGWYACKIPGEQDRQSIPIRALRDVLSSQIIHTKHRESVLIEKNDTLKRKLKNMRGKKFVL